MNGHLRRPAGRIGLAVAAVVVVGGGAYGIAHVDRGDPGPVTAPPATSESESTGVPPPLPHGNVIPIEPGTYRMLVGFDPAGAKIEADLTITNWQWHSSGQPVVSAGDIWAGIGVYQPIALAGVGPCSGDWRSRPASRSPQTLAQQLGRLPRSRVIEPLTPTRAFGHDAIHLRLRVDDQCPKDEYYQIAKTSAGSRGTPAASRGISYGSNSTEVLIDFWVVDMDGTTVVVDMWQHVVASTEFMAGATEVLDSIDFVMSELRPGKP